jgi:beta-glucosidase
MTLAEKIGQLNLVSAGTEFDPRQVSEGRIGGLSNFSDPREIAALQDMARRSRLGIPLLVGLDVLHGYRTMFPVPLGEAASFSPDLARRVAEASAREAAAVGINWTFAPMVDLSRDPRWGRIVEGAGEDPLLGRLFAAARVAGFRAGGVAPTPKHFAGYGAAQGGRDYDATEIPRVDLYDFYLPPFRASIRAGAEILMSAFNALNGVPATANPWLLTELLRHEWGFDGFVVSDWAAIWELIPHGIARDEAEAGRKALLAGVDMDMASDIYAGRLPDEIRAGRVPEAALDEAVRRVLRVKLRLGLFERPDPDPAGAEQAQLTPETRQLAREAARESIVLLQNRELPRPGAPQPDVLQRSVPQRSVLPIAPGTRRIAVVGGLAASPSDQLGPHAARADPKDVITYLDGIRRRAEAAGMSVTYAPGCDPLCERADGFMEAVEAARAADVVIAVLGEPQDISAEGGSRAYLTLPGRQRELLDALTATGTPVVLVLETGRPLELGAAVEKIPAIVMAWYLGTEGGPALADILFGDESPSAKLPVSWPRTVGQVPVHYNRLPTGRPADPKSRWTARYRDEDVRPLFPFGWGLGYTRFAYTGLDVATPTVGAQDVVELRVTVTNTGERAGKEVAQLYVRQPVASRSRPLRELKAFEKIALQPGESRAVTFRVPVRDLGFHLDDGSYVVEPGPFQAWIGGNSLADLEGGFEVTDGLRLPPGAAP